MASFFSMEQTPRPRPPLGPNWDCTAWFVYLANCLPPVRTCVCASEGACISFCIGTHKRRGTFREAHTRPLRAHRCTCACLATAGPHCEPQRGATSGSLSRVLAHYSLHSIGTEMSDGRCCGHLRERVCGRVQKAPWWMEACRLTQ